MRVLLVEDEALILMQLEVLVEEAGHLVVGTATRSAEAVEVAFATRPDVVLLDLSLSDGDSGLDVAAALQPISGLVVVFITANPRRLGNHLAGAAGVITKPFSRAVLVRGLSYVEECVRNPPPVGLPPIGMRMAPHFQPRSVQAASLI